MASVKALYFIFISFLFTGFPPSVLTAQDTRWKGPTLAESGWVDTKPGFMGWIWSGPEGRSDWIYPAWTGQYLYLPSMQIRDAGGWAYVGNIRPWELVPVATTETGWYAKTASQGWVYAPASTVDAGRGWVYLVNSGGPLPLAPEPVVLQSVNVADHEAQTIEERYAEALRLPASYIAQFAHLDPDIEMTRGPEGVTFRNTLLFPGGMANRQVRIGFDEGSGIMDFSAISGISGKAGLVLHADADLTNTTNGFYVRVKQGELDVAAYEYLPADFFMQDVLLEPYLTIARDNAYLEITLPWQGSVTLRDLYLYMDAKVRGFSDMEAKITGGAGATPENIHTVANASELVAALQAVQAAGAPSIINISGTITYDDWIAAGQEGREAAIGPGMSDLSIIGNGPGAVLDGVGLAIQTSNVIVQNLTIRYVLARDAIQVNNGSFVKIDHCTLYNESFAINPDKDKFDELISIKNNAHSVIVSWNEIFDSHKTILVGSNDGVDALPDRKVIFHHNWFHDTGSRHPLYRGGYAHIYNNYYERVNSAIDTRTNAKLLVENNYFNDVHGAISYYPTSSGGLEVHNNIFENVDGGARTASTIDIQFAGEYHYTLDPPEDVPMIVKAGAGAGKL